MPSPAALTAAHQQIEELEREKASLRLERDGLEHVRLCDNARLIDRAEAAEANLAQAQADAAQLREEQEADLDRLQEAGLAIEELRTQVAQLRERVRELEQGLRDIVGDDAPFADFQMAGKAEDRERAIYDLARSLIPQEQGEADG